MLTIDLESVCFLVVKAHAFDAEVEVTESDAGSNPANDDQRETLRDYESDPTYEELKGYIDSLNEDEQIDLVTLTWIGRGDFTGKEWKAARREARSARSDHTATYLLGMPLLGDYLEEGLAQLGYSCEDYELGRL
ncbi:MAG: DUF3775 domain-containing protein [Rhodospirillales bacterium]|nr:DUF3775 domain-containing protein [Rhodospirillales bacterium]